ncbi:3-hydroxyacyl-CoA dehydrogenase [Jiella sonneratiae]|uniref:3-hydroxyacyl-CoA dehydrogenase n=1 Tax=Jiella sonneratiae TaxID=2816856 RepID=A0ABS3J564_9HYPH|nr:3-hydroxyacyl-CoA dehydrogenase [Jiella sonneratiae]MBO0904814.1 3-hydroxyacyl-CoA dehydrogenase [Jiella sonneratiae]
MTPSETTVAIVGSGLIGRAWAITFARAGCRVKLSDPDPAVPEKAVGFVASVVDDLAANGLLRGSTPAETLSRIGCHAALEDALDGAHWVQECGPEAIAVKRETFARLDAAAGPETILASSSSALLPSAISEGLPGRSRCLVAHPINPPYLVPAVELVPAPWTAPWVIEKAETLMHAVGQAPLIMAREIDGFIMNRLQGALLEEAFRLVAGGYASPEDVDRGIADGLALRWSFMGPFETIDLNAPGGVADYVARYQGLYRGLFEGMKERVDWAGPVLKTVLASRREKLSEERLAERQLWRDKRLMALSAHKQRADDDIGR